MPPEESDEERRLREALRREAEKAVPDPDALRRIRQRNDLARRRRRAWLRRKR